MVRRYKRFNLLQENGRFRAPLLRWNSQYFAETQADERIYRSSTPQSLG